MPTVSDFSLLNLKLLSKLTINYYIYIHKIPKILKFYKMSENSEDSTIFQNY